MIDYMVMEAIALKVNKIEADERKSAEIKQWQEQQRQRLKQEFN